MTIERVLGPLFALLVVSAGGCGAGVSNRSADQLDTSRYPSEIQDAYRVFAVRCSRCHTLARPLGARIGDDRHWVRYVARMRRQPGSGINHKNADTILKFLLFYTAQVRYEEEGGEPGTFPGLVSEGPTSDETPATSGVSPGDSMPAEPPSSEAEGGTGDTGESLQPGGSDDPLEPALDGAGREP